MSPECIVPWPFLCVAGLVLFPEPEHEEEENRPSPESSPLPLRVTGEEALPALRDACAVTVEEEDWNRPLCSVAEQNG